MARYRTPQSGLRNSALYDDTLAAGVALETAPTDIQGDFNSLRSMLKNAVGKPNWHDAPTSTLETVNANVAAVAGYKQLYFTEHAANITVPNNKYMTLGVGEFPVGTLAVGASTATGIVTIQSASYNLFLQPVAGLNPTHPKNLCMIVDSVTGHDLFAAASGNKIQGLLVTTGNDGAPSTSTNMHIQFIELNATGDGFVFAQASDVSGKVINYAYARREIAQNIPEDAHLNSNFSEGFAAVDVTLASAYANQIGDVAQANNININIADAKVWELFDPTGLNTILKAAPNVGNDVLAIGGDLLDINSLAVDAFAGITVGTGGANALDLGATTAGDISSVAGLNVRAGSTMAYSDGFVGASSWTGTEVKLAANAAAWTSYKAQFGEVGLLEAVTNAATSGSTRTRYDAVSTASAVAGANITGAAGSPNLSAQLGDYSALNFVTNVELFVNKKLLIPGAALVGIAECAAGTNQATGDFVMDYDLEHEADDFVPVSMFINA